MEEQRYSITIEDLPTEILLHIFSFLRIPDLVQLLTVSRNLRRLVEGSQEYGYNIIWAKASTEGVPVNQKNIKHFERAAKFGNKEALVKLAVAYLYSEGVPDGAGRGTDEAENGIKAAEYIVKLETLPRSCRPFSWMLIRPPFSRDFVCCKACVCKQIKQLLNEEENKSEFADLYYVLGKAMSFHEDPIQHGSSLHYYQTGAELGSMLCSYEYWKAIHKIKLSPSDVAIVRELRQIVNSYGEVSGLACDAKFELCKQYALGNYGGLPQPLALAYIHQVMSTSPPLLADKLLKKAKHKINLYMMLVLVDWIVEVSDMRCFDTHTVHMSIQLVQRYLLKRSLTRSKIQLLGITALLVAARWSSVPILTIREAASVTDDTYTYQDVVTMMADLIAALDGDVLHPLPSVYLEIMVLLTSCGTKTEYLAAYISETCVIHSEFGGLSSAHYSATCFLLARILLYEEFPWPNELVQATGLTVSDLKDTVIHLYIKCYTDELACDYRGEKLNAINIRYSSEDYYEVGKIQVMSLTELKECLGLSLPVSPLSPLSPSLFLDTSSFNPRRLFSLLNNAMKRSPNDPVLDQSFIQEFNSHFITDPAHSSPPPSVASSIPSLIQQSSPAHSSPSIIPPLIQQSSPAHSSPSIIPPLIQQSSPVHVSSDSSLAFDYPLPNPLIPFMDRNHSVSPISSVGGDLTSTVQSCAVVTQGNTSSGSMLISSNESGSSSSSAQQSPSLFSEETIEYNSKTLNHSSCASKKRNKLLKNKENCMDGVDESCSDGGRHKQCHFTSSIRRPVNKLTRSQRSFDDKFPLKLCPKRKCKKRRSS